MSEIETQYQPPDDANLGDRQFDISPEGKQPETIDINSVLSTLPPIEGVFSPEAEVQKLRGLPREQKKDAVILLKDKLNRQREAWALCGVAIEDRLNENPDLPKDEMRRIIQVFSQHYGFDRQSMRNAEELIDRYTDFHKRIKSVRERIPDDASLINI
jgi:hypothetical protein